MNEFSGVLNDVKEKKIKTKRIKKKKKQERRGEASIRTILFDERERRSFFPPCMYKLYTTSGY